MRASELSPIFEDSAHARAGALDKDAAGAGENKEPAGAQARRKRPKIRPPQREGWIDVYEELTRVAFLEADRHEYQRKWVLLRDCWMYLYDSQEDVSLGREAETDGETRVETGSGQTRFKITRQFSQSYACM